MNTNPSNEISAEQQQQYRQTLAQIQQIIGTIGQQIQEQSQSSASQPVRAETIELAKQAEELAQTLPDWLRKGLFDPRSETASRSPLHGEDR